jgi:hypothetical protein
MNDFKNWFPPILMAQTIMVMIPIGAIPRRMSSGQPIEVDRNCLVISSPKRVKSGAKLVKALFSKDWLSTVGVADAPVAVDVEVLVDTI